MNTNNVYFAEIHRIISEECFDNNIWNAKVKFETKYVRQTLVFHKGDNKYIDLMGKGMIPFGKDYCSIVGTEYISPSSLIPFNEVVEQHRRNLPKCLIRRMATKHLYTKK